MEKYTRVKKDMESPAAAENEVRVMSNGKLRYYITVALALLEEKQMPTILLKAMGRAINKTVAIAEIVKRRVPGLHQLTELSSVSITDTWEPKEDGLTTLTVARNVSAITIHLSTGGLDTSHPGYQPPLPAEEVVPIGEQELDEMEAGDNGGGGGRGRGGRGRGRGRGRGGRGRAPVEGGGEGAAGDGLADLGAAEGGVPENGEAPGRGRNRRGRGRGRRSGRGRGANYGEGAAADMPAEA